MALSEFAESAAQLTERKSAFCKSSDRAGTLEQISELSQEASATSAAALFIRFRIPLGGSSDSRIAGIVLFARVTDGRLLDQTLRFNFTATWWMEDHIERYWLQFLEWVAIRLWTSRAMHVVRAA